MNDILDKIKETCFSEGPEEAKVELATYSDRLQQINGPEWVSFKARLKSFLKISEKDLGDLKRTNTIKVRSENDWRGLLQFDKFGEIKTGIRNCSTIIDNHPLIKDGVKFNTFLQRVCLTKNMPFAPDIRVKEGGFVEFDDNKLSQINKWLAHEAQQFSKTDILDSITSTALSNNFNPLAEKLTECVLAWDGKPRLDTWLFDYLEATTHEGVDEEAEREYISKVGAMWMISAAKRAFYPGCKVDTMLILEGIQGKQKSSFISDLSLGYSLELTTSLTKSKDVVDLMLGKWIIELPELQALTGDSNANKAFLTRQNDKERLSYAKFSKDFPRRCVFIGTTNEDRYLKDITGNRRFWPVKVKNANRKKLKEDLEQLWGEAVMRMEDGEKWWFDDEKDQKAIDVSLKIQGIKQDYDETVDQLKSYLDDKEYVISLEVWTDFYKGTVDRFNNSEQQRVGKALRLCGWKRVNKKIKKKTTKVWVNGAEK